MKPGFIGLGNVGSKLAVSLLRNGHDLTVFDLDTARVQEFVAKGAGSADSARALIRASDLLVIAANDPATLDQPDAPDPTAWGLHGSIHRLCPHARCVMHTHSNFSTVLASLADSRLPPIDQNTAMFFNRTVIDEQFGGLAFEEEGKRCAVMLSDPARKVMIMADTFGAGRLSKTASSALHQGIGRAIPANPRCAVCCPFCL